MPTVHTTVDSPVGPLLLTADDTGLTRVLFPRTRGVPARVDDGWVADDGAHGTASAVLASARAQLGDYFAGRRRTFDLPLAPAGTPFQRRVWEALRTLGFGETVSYAELARRAGAPGAARAIGAANGRNPIPVVVPCHRVIGADGTLTGFGGGMAAKEWLLAHEGAWPRPLGAPAVPPPARRRAPTPAAASEQHHLGIG
jgi:methylated-DNA-[protein]-cysteine S-methyltransferase